MLVKDGEVADSEVVEAEDDNKWIKVRMVNSRSRLTQVLVKTMRGEDEKRQVEVNKHTYGQVIFSHRSRVYPLLLRIAASAWQDASRVSR